MRNRSFASLFVTCLALVACNSTPAAVDTGTSGGNDAGRDAFVAPMDDSGSTADAGSDAAMSTADAGCDGVLLTVLNILSWCDVTVNGGTAFGGSSETVCVPANTNIDLVHTAHGGFILGKWFGTSGDTGAGEDGTVSGMMSTAQLMTGAAGTTACVSVCCPFPDGSGCPTTDSCP